MSWHAPSWRLTQHVASGIAQKLAVTLVAVWAVLLMGKATGIRIFSQGLESYTICVVSRVLRKRRWSLISECTCSRMALHRVFLNVIMFGFNPRDFKSSLKSCPKKIFPWSCIASNSRGQRQSHCESTFTLDPKLFLLSIEWSSINHNVRSIMIIVSRASFFLFFNAI